MRGEANRTGKKSTTPKRDTGEREHKKKPVGALPNGLKNQKSMKGKTNCEKRSGTLLLNFYYAKLDVFFIHASSFNSVLSKNFNK